MNKLQLTILFLLFIKVFPQSFILISNPSTASVIYPQNQQSIIATNFTINQPTRLVGHDISPWISTSIPSKVAVYQSLFYSTSKAAASIYIRSYNTFYAFLNGQLVYTGNTKNTYSFSRNLYCGMNNFTVRVQNVDSNISYTALAFYLLQTYSTQCNGISNNGIYDYQTCNCQCLGDFNCNSLQQKIGYPTCGCKCINQLTCNTLKQFYDQKQCRCKCFPIQCKQDFQQDPVTCNCLCKSKKCTSGKWNYNQCRCI